MQFRLSLTTSILLQAFVLGTTPTITAAQSPPTNPVDAYIRQARYAKHERSASPPSPSARVAPAPTAASISEPS